MTVHGQEQGMRNEQPLYSSSRQAQGKLCMLHGHEVGE